MERIHILMTSELHIDIYCKIYLLVSLSTLDASKRSFVQCTEDVLRGGPGGGGGSP